MSIALGLQTGYAQGISVNESGSAPHPGAILDVNSSNKGLLVPRTETALITEPAAGMIIFDTVAMQVMVYNGFAWSPVQCCNTEYSFWYADADGDGFGDPFTVVYAPFPPPMWVDNHLDCDDTRNTVYPGALEICDNLDNDCNGVIDDIVEGSGVGTIYYPDLDGDGYAASTDNAIEACTAPPGYAELLGDCNDNDASVNPGAFEICDDVDNDCNGITDDIQPGAGLGTYFYRDLDSDGFGEEGNFIEACSPPVGYAFLSGDCDDTNDNVYPGAPEICDGIDNDCDGVVDLGGCFINGECYAPGESNPESPCLYCYPDNPNGWTFSAEGTPCVEGYCNFQGECVECLEVGHCPESPSPCTEYLCINGDCILVVKANGTECPDGFCQNGICDQN